MASMQLLYLPISEILMILQTGMGTIFLPAMQSLAESGRKFMTMRCLYLLLILEL